MNRYKLLIAILLTTFLMNGLVFAQDTTLTVTSAGNVGIGTSNPNEKLHIEGTGTYGVAIRVADPSNNVEVILRSMGNEELGAVGTATNHDFHISTNGTARMVIDNDGNVAIGNNTASNLNKLYIRSDLDESLWYSQSIGISTPQANDVMRIGFVDETAEGYVSAQIESARYPGDGGYLAFKTRAIGGGIINEAMRIDQHGNIGIGTTNATSKIDINGTQGYNQLRIRTSYTPSNSSDPNGNVGDISWDNNYVYVKTNNGWKRSALNTW